jgi:hypothetical protein
MTTDGVVGALLQDRFGHLLSKAEAPKALVGSAYWGVRMDRFVGWIVFLAGFWMLLSPQALVGVAGLQWMAKYAFPGEVLMGIFVIGLAYYLLRLKPTRIRES